MTQSRRQFLQRLAASAAALGLEPLRGIAVMGDLYRNDRLGLALRKPPGWEFSSIADFAALRERQVLTQVLGDDEPHPLKDPRNLPVFLFENPRFRDGDFAPAISLYDEALRGSAPVDAIAAHRDVMLAGFAAAYRDVEVVDGPAALRVSDADATISHWTYNHDLEDGASYRLSVRSVLVFREPRVHTYHLVDAAASAHVAEATWDAFVSSIRYSG